MATDGDDAVVYRGARHGCVCSSATADGDRRGQRGGRPRGTTRVCVLVSHSRWRPTGTTRWSAEGHGAAVPVSHSRWRPTGTTWWSTEGHDAGVCARQRQPMATDGDDAVVDRGARRGRARRPQPMATDGEDAVVDAVVDRGARRGRARSSSTPAGRRSSRGTTGVCLMLVSHNRWRPTGTTLWWTEGHDAGVPGRRAQPMATDRHDAVVPSRRSRSPEPPRPPSPQTDDAAASTARWEGGMRSNRRGRPSPCRRSREEGGGGKCRRVRQPRCRRARGKGGGRKWREAQASDAVPLMTGTRGGRGRAVQASKDRPNGRLFHPLSIPEKLTPAPG